MHNVTAQSDKSPIMTAILAVDELSVSFRRGRDWSPAVAGVSFEVMPNETVAIVGESGSGKSVTALSIMRLHAATTQVHGSIKLNGQELLVLPEDEIRRVRGNEIAMVFQEPMTS